MSPEKENAKNIIKWLLSLLPTFSYHLVALMEIKQSNQNLQHFCYYVFIKNDIARHITLLYQVKLNKRLEF